MSSAAILLAAGRGSRTAQTLPDKITALLANKPTFQYSLEAFRDSKVIDHFTVVYREDSQKFLLESISKEVLPSDTTALQWIQGGSERQDSVYKALSSLPKSIKYVFIHDCARPLIQPHQIQQLHKAVQKSNATVLAHKATDTLKETISMPDALTNCQLKNLDRSKLWAMETPQVFEKTLIQSAYQNVVDSNLTITDDTSAIIINNTPISIIENTQPNPKITYPQDVDYITFLLNKNSL